MKLFVDDGSTAIKVQWNGEDGIQRVISANSFKREWSVAFGGKAFNYELDGDLYSFDPISADALITTNVKYQYSDVNVIAVHHALQNTGLQPQDVEIVVTLPLSEFYDRHNQPNKANITKKQQSLMREVKLNGGDTFTFTKVTVMPESIPAGFDIVSNLSDLDSLLIVDLGGTTLDISHVQSKMKGITKVYGNSNLGVSIITSAVNEALAMARTKGSSYLANEIIVHRDDPEFLNARINDPSQIELVLKSLNAEKARLVSRVIDAIDGFHGWSHMMIIGGGAPLIADEVKRHYNVRNGRFYISTDPQFDLVDGMYKIG